MTINNFKIRETQQNNNPKTAKAIRKVLIEFGAPKVGTAYEDAVLDTLFEEYSTPNSVYYVIEKVGKIYGSLKIYNANSTI